MDNDLNSLQIRGCWLIPDFVKIADVSSNLHFILINVERDVDGLYLGGLDVRRKSNTPGNRLSKRQRVQTGNC